MRTKRLVGLAIIGFAGVGTLSADIDDASFPPVAYPVERYEAMMKRSPFVLPSFSEEVAVTDNWTEDYRIVSVLKLGNDSVVIVKKISTDERIPVREKENAQGIRLLELEMSPDPHNVSARIEMGGEEGTIQYDESILSDAPRSVAPNNPAVKSE